MRKYLRVDTNDVGIKNLHDQRTDLMDAFSKRKNIQLVLDDVWDKVHEYDDVVECLNFAKGPGSVTLIITRIEAVTVHACEGVDVILQLSDDQSWELFCTHAFGTYPTPSNILYLELAKAVCNECKCLPLALKVIGTAMRGKRDMAEWRKTLCRLQESTSVNKRVEEQLFDRLKISYDELPDEATKVCFLYFAAFPEDCAISKEHLCKIWMVEGLFGKSLSKQATLDEGHCVLNKLRAWSLIEDCSILDDLYTVKCVRMYDILRDLANESTRCSDDCARKSLFKLDMKDLEAFPTS